MFRERRQPTTYTAAQLEVPFVDPKTHVQPDEKLLAKGHPTNLLRALEAV